jgi:hypothetical protein
LVDDGVTHTVRVVIGTPTAPSEVVATVSQTTASGR